MVETPNVLRPDMARTEGFFRSSGRPLSEIPRPNLVHFSIEEDERAILVDGLFILTYFIDFVEDNRSGEFVKSDELGVYKPRGLFIVFPNDDRNQVYHPPRIYESVGRIERMQVSGRGVLNRRKFYIGEDYELFMVAQRHPSIPPRTMEVILSSTQPIEWRDDIDPRSDKYSYLEELRRGVRY